MVEEGEQGRVAKVYPLTTKNDIMKWCNENNKELWEYVVEYKRRNVGLLRRVWDAMQAAVEAGLSKADVLPEL